MIVLPPKTSSLLMALVLASHRRQLLYAEHLVVSAVHEVLNPSILQDLPHAVSDAVRLVFGAAQELQPLHLTLLRSCHHHYHHRGLS